MYSVTKSFDFSYAHRVWAQNLSNGMKPKCRQLHGHNAKVIVELRQDELQDHEVVLDYNEFKWIKAFLDDTLDHKTILDINDPVVSKMNIDVKKAMPIIINIPGIDIPIHTSFMNIKDPDEYEDSFVFISGIPTSENFARILFGLFEVKFGDCIYSVTFKESDNTSASYMEE